MGMGFDMGKRMGIAWDGLGWDGIGKEDP